MVRGNWQKRVETAQARRQEAKQRKQRTEDKKHFKNWVQDLFRVLDKHSGVLNQRRIHIWTDAIPSDGPPLLDLMESPSNGGKQDKRRPRGNSIGDERSSSSKGTRGRSNSLNEGKSSKKKAHPRSRESIEEPVETEMPLLCRSYFFSGKCEESSRKKGSCRHVHYPLQYLTLGQAVSVKEKPANLQQLVASDSCVEVSDETGAAMDMIYYISIGIGADASVSEAITNALSEKKVALSSIVYVVLEGTLVFDRFREGLVFDDEEELVQAVRGVSVQSRRKVSIGSEHEALGASFELLPGTVLEHILTYLPDTAVASSSRVCKTWYYEIGQNSPELWRHLLDRRQWPHPNAVDVSPARNEGFDLNNDGVKVKQQMFRETFLGHYSAMRDASAIQLGLGVLEGSRKGVVAKEMAYQDFSTRKHAPMESDHCSSVLAWGDNQVLASYGADCTLRLFESKLSENNEMTCKELICQNVDPYKNTKKRKCRLLTSGFDEECIGSLCLVSTDKMNVHAYILVVINRDDFLLGESSFSMESTGVADGNLLNVIDIGEAVLNFLFSAEDCDNTTVGVGVLLRLVDFLEGGGEVGDVEVVVSRSLAACGYGRFMVEVSIAIPSADERELDVGEMTQIGRKLVLFSAGAGAIVWMGESPQYDNLLLPRSESVSLVSLRRPRTGSAGSRVMCSIAVSPKSMPGEVRVIDIEPSGEVCERQVFACPIATQTLLQEDVWEAGSPFRSVVLNRSWIVVVDDIISAHGEFGRPGQVMLSFLSRFDLNDSIGTLTIDGMMAMQTVCVREEYLFVLCVESPGRREAIGPWFGAEQPDPVCMWTVVVHVPSHREIGRQMWQKNSQDFNEDPRSIVLTPDSTHTLGACLSGKGVVMTGSSVRAKSIGVASTDTGASKNSQAAKKKKKKKPAKSAKKDGFARGMSLRG